MKTINMGEKITLTALQLVYLLDEAIEEGRYRAVYNQERDCWDLMFRDVLCASFYVGRYPCAEDKVDAEVSRLNAEYGKEEK